MSKKTLKDLKIGHQYKTFIVAEAGINHNGNFQTALKMVRMAKKAGADAIKFQTYVTEKRVSRDNPVFSILKKCELSYAQQAKIKKYADQIGIIFFSTPFDEQSIRFLKDIKVSLIKIASFDIVNNKLLQVAAATRIPLIVSRGMANLKEINRAIKVIKKHGTDFALLHCVSSYPAPKEEINLKAILALKKHNQPVGYSDHTLDIDASLYAVAMGACIIEKHFTLDRKMEGPDQAMSVDPADLALLSKKIRELEKMLGSGELKALAVEKTASIFRRPSKIK